jgi:hypothetical protein
VSVAGFWECHDNQVDRQVFAFAAAQVSMAAALFLHVHLLR